MCTVLKKKGKQRNGERKRVEENVINKIFIGQIGLLTLTIGQIALVNNIYFGKAPEKVIAIR